MRSDSEPTGRAPGRPRSFTERARRRQFVDAAIAVVNEHGYTGTTLARVAEHAGVSKGIVSYHFDGKAELLETTVEEVFARGVEFATRTWFADDAMTPPALLRAYLESNLAYIAANPHEVGAAVEIIRNHRDAEGRLAFGAAWEEPLLQPLEEIFREGQRAGVFRAFSPRLMAVAVRRVIDGFTFQLLADPSLDVDAYTAEVRALFEHATRAEGGR